MNRRIAAGFALCLAACLAAGLLAVVQADDDEETITWDQLPAAVQEKLAEHRDQISEMEKEVENGKTVYEVEFKVDGKEKEVTYDAEGNVLEVEMEITLDELPDAVRTIVSALAFRGEIEELSKETEGGEVTYEVEIDRDGLAFEFEMDPDGNVLEIEIEDDHEGEDEDEDEEVIDWDEVPAAVQAVFKEHAGDAAIEEVEVEMENGKKVYEAEFEKDGKRWELEVDEEGNVLEFEEED